MNLLNSINHLIESINYLSFKLVVNKLSGVILIFGSSGVGKSTLYNVITEKEKSLIGHTAYRETKEIIFDGKIIDIPGTDKNDLFKLSQYLVDNKLKISFLLWLIFPSLRITDVLEREAAYINSLGDNIWDNTIILLTHPSTGLFSNDILGVKEVMNYYKKKPKIYKYSLDGTFKISMVLKKIITNNKNKVTIIPDINVYCKKCEYKGNILTIPLNCHDMIINIHSNKQYKKHKSNFEKKNIISSGKWICCDSGKNNPGCIIICEKCKKDITEEGCIKICKYCNNEIGTIGCHSGFKHLFS